MKIVLILTLLFAATCRAAIGPHPVQRIRMTDTDTEAVYKDKMSDGTYRDSKIDKPQRPEYPERISLIATNDATRFWELVYENAYAGGKKSTNYMAVLKDKRDVIKDNLRLPPMPKISTNAPAKTDALALAKNRILGPHVAVTNSVKRMGKREPRILTSMMANGKVVQTMTDGTVRIEKLRTAHTARVDPAKWTAVGETDANGGALAGASASAAALAAAAAAAGYVAGKKSKG